MAKRIELESLAGLEHLVAALETEDVLGAVLRAQLQVEQQIELFLVANVADGMWDVAGSLPQNFSQKVTLAAALGFPKALCSVALAINQIRNKFAHKAGWTLRQSDIDNLVDKYDAARGEVDPVAQDVRKSYTQLHGIGGERIDFGTKGPEWDFKIISGWIVALILRYMVMENLKHGFGPP
ncbi:hypothetical protein [Stenotrophomonas maltophilia]|uniref:hypothetical protein n=1 Tax=Stenotrophomonas maltophilia TaxID=40324 RepID=UPI0013DA4495|nr:hypothetical protein [Stenotrophomonas maltophilia]